MNKNQLCLTLLAGFIISNFLSSCKKDATPSKPNCKIVAVIAGNNATSFTYDTDGRLSSKSSSAGTDRFTYNGNTINITSTNGTTVNSVKTVTLNANGLASNVSTNDGAGTHLSDIVYEYQGTELSKETFTTPLGDTLITIHAFSNGNMISSQTNTDTITFGYSTGVPANTGDLWNLSNLVQGYETIRTKNVLTSIESGGNISTINYVFDTEGKITGLNNVSNGVLVTFSYQYDCN